MYVFQVLDMNKITNIVTALQSKMATLCKTINLKKVSCSTVQWLII